MFCFLTQNLVYAGKCFMWSYKNTFSVIVEWSSANVSIMSFSWQHWSSSLHPYCFFYLLLITSGRAMQIPFFFFIFFFSSISLNLMNLEPLFKVSQIEKDSWHLHSESKKKWYKWTNLQNRNRVTSVENKLMITKEQRASVQFSPSVILNLWPHGPKHARPPCPSSTQGVYSNSCPLKQWCHPTISASVFPFSSRLQSLPAS